MELYEKTPLQTDLILDYQRRRLSINDQINLLDPIAQQLQSNKIQRLLKSWSLAALEIVCWIGAIIALAGIFFTQYVPPFNFLVQQLQTVNWEMTAGKIGYENLLVGIKILFGIIAILLIIMSRMLASMRVKNKMLAVAAVNLKKVAQELLNERSYIHDLHIKYPIDLPITNDAVINNTKNTAPNGDTYL